MHCRLHGEPVCLIPSGLIINSLIISSFIVLFLLRHKGTQALNCFIILDTKSLISEVLKVSPYPTSGSICCRHAWGPFIPSSILSQLHPQHHLIKPHWAEFRLHALCVMMSFTPDSNLVHSIISYPFSEWKKKKLRLNKGETPGQPWSKEMMESRCEQRLCPDSRTSGHLFT